jgi:hypothetical protein
VLRKLVHHPTRQRRNHPEIQVQRKLRLQMVKGLLRLHEQLSPLHLNEQRMAVQVLHRQIPEGQVLTETLQQVPQ